MAQSRSIPSWYDVRTRWARHKLRTTEEATRPLASPGPSGTKQLTRKECKVRCLDKEGKLIKEETVKYGADATVDGYEFSGWDRAFDNVTEDIDVTALYRELPKPVEPTPPVEEPQQPQDDGVANDLVQTGIELAPFLAPLLVSLIAAVALVRRIRRR